MHSSPMHRGRAKGGSSRDGLGLFVMMVVAIIQLIITYLPVHLLNIAVTIPRENHHFKSPATAAL